jgi:hypothetical protein
MNIWEAATPWTGRELQNRWFKTASPIPDEIENLSHRNTTRLSLAVLCTSKSAGLFPAKKIMHQPIALRNLKNDDGEHYAEPEERSS